LRFVTRSLVLRTIAWLAAAIVLLSDEAAPKTQYFCHMMGRVVASCCCAGEDGASKVECRAEARAPDCCERIESRKGHALPAAPEKATSGLSPVALSVLPECVPPPPRRAPVARLREARAPPAVGPPLFLAHCAILI
jgi:hypothetical protein